jgi:hypothetical protein
MIFYEPDRSPQGHNSTETQTLCGTLCLRAFVVQFLKFKKEE